MQGDYWQLKWTDKLASLKIVLPGPNIRFEKQANKQTNKQKQQQ